MARARKVCTTIGCPLLSLPGTNHCETHTVEARQLSRGRRTPRPRYDSTEWKRKSKAFLEEHPLCADGCGGRATVVDHIRPHRGDPVLFWDTSNWQGLTKKHHDSKTAREDGGFGNRSGARGEDAKGDDNLARHNRG